MIPESFTSSLRWQSASEEEREWLANLPGCLEAALGRWELTLDGQTLHGWEGVALPVKRGEERLMLKAQLPSPLQDRQISALREWQGWYTVTLMETDAPQGLMLLERLDAKPAFGDLPLNQRITLTGGLLSLTSRRPAQAAYPHTHDAAREMRDSLDQCNAAMGHPLHPDQCDTVRAAIRQITDRPRPHALFNADLHDEQVLHRPGQGWCVIDPRPMVGDREYMCGGLLWSWGSQLPDEASVLRALDLLAESGDLDRELAHAWAQVRAADYLLWGLEHGLTQDPQHCHRILRAVELCPPATWNSRQATSRAINRLTRASRPQSGSRR